MGYMQINSVDGDYESMSCVPVRSSAIGKDSPKDGSAYSSGRGYEQLQTFVKNTLE